MIWFSILCVEVCWDITENVAQCAQGVQGY